VSVGAAVSRLVRWAMEMRWLSRNAAIVQLQDHRLRLLAQERYADARRLNRYEMQVFSQNGEDGILREVLRRIGEGSRTFVELGVESGLENNTAFLLVQGWTGAWLEGSPRHGARIRKHFAEALGTGQLRLGQVRLTAENVGREMQRLQVATTPDVLSIDIDRNTYDVLAAILSTFSPRVVVSEYNGLFPPPVSWRTRYVADRGWNRSSYFGASLTALHDLLKGHGYALVGCDLCGVNAFFVREDLCGEHFLRPFTPENHYEPLRDYLVHRAGFPRALSDDP
jgi:hypothetical protein